MARRVGPPPAERDWQAFEHALETAMSPRDARGEEAKVRMPFELTCSQALVLPGSLFVVIFVVIQVLLTIGNELGIGPGPGEREPWMLPWRFGLYVFCIVITIASLKLFHPKSEVLHKQFVKRRDGHYRALVSNARRGDTQGLRVIPLAVSVAEALRGKELRGLQFEQSLGDGIEITHDVDVAIPIRLSKQFWLNELRAVEPALTDEAIDDNPSAEAFRSALVERLGAEGAPDRIRVDHVMDVGGRTVVANVKQWEGHFRPGAKGRLFECDDVAADIVAYRERSATALAAAARSLAGGSVPVAMVIVDSGSVEGRSFSVPLRDCELVIAEFDAAVDKLRALSNQVRREA